MFKTKSHFDANKTKVNLKMLTNRFQLLIKKRANLAKQQKRQVATLLREKKEQNARILVEQIIREDYTLESYEILRQYTEILITRLPILASESGLITEVAEAVCSLVYAGRLYGTEIPELKVLQKQFEIKYGPDFGQHVIERKEIYLNHRLLRILTSTQVPDSSVVELYLKEIAKAYNVDFIPRTESSPVHISSTIGVPLPPPGAPAGSKSPTPIPGPMELPGTLPRPTTTGMAVSGAATNGLPNGQLSLDGLGPRASCESTARSGPIFFSVQLQKGAAGFGMSLTTDNLVSMIIPGSEAERGGIIMPGDRVLELNGYAVTEDKPVKSFVLDIAEGETATFSFVREQTGKSALEHSHEAGPNGSAHLTPSSVETFAIDPKQPPSASLPITTASTPPPPPLPVAPPSLLCASDEDDALARRLELLKRG